MEYTIKVTTTGADGAAQGTARTERPVEGLIMAAKIDYHASAPASTVVILTGVGGLAQQVLNLAASNTDKVMYPRVKVQDNTGVDTGSYEPYYVPGRYLELAVTLSNALANCVIVTLYVVPLS